MGRSVISRFPGTVGFEASSFAQIRLVESLLIEADVDPCDLIYPLLPFRVFHVHNLLIGPVKMVGDISYLLEKPVEGVAYDPPMGTTSCSKVCPQEGHATGTTFWPSSLMFRYKS